MTTQEKNQRLAEWAGWTRVENYLGVDYGIPPNLVNPAFKQKLPDYFTSLDAVHELEMRLGNSANPTLALWWQYITTLTKICGDVPAIFATAAQRAEALGITLGLWKEGE